MSQKLCICKLQIITSISCDRLWPSDALKKQNHDLFKDIVMLHISSDHISDRSIQISGFGLFWWLLILSCFIIKTIFFLENGGVSRDNSTLMATLDII